MKTIKVRPILVESKEKDGILWLTDSNVLILTHVSGEFKEKYKPQQLVLISLDPNEKIEVGEYYLHKQAQLSLELIQTLIKQHNNGGMEDFDIEMERRTYQPVDINYDKSGEPFNNYSPKLTNGFITVQPVINFKDASSEEIQRRFPPTYTEEEVRVLVWESRIFFSQHKDTPFRHIRNYFNNWFEKNKKK